MQEIPFHNKADIMEKFLHKTISNGLKKNLFWMGQKKQRERKNFNKFLL